MAWSLFTSRDKAELDAGEVQGPAQSTSLAEDSFPVRTFPAVKRMSDNRRSNLRTAASTAIREGDYGKLEKLVRRHGGEPEEGNSLTFLLHTAWALRNPPAVKLLLDYGAHPSIILMEACANKQVDLVKVLFEYGADVHMNIDSKVDKWGEEGLLRRAAERGALDLVNLLLEQGAEPQKVAKGVFFDILRKGDFGIAQAFVAGGYKPDEYLEMVQRAARDGKPGAAEFRDFLEKEGFQMPSLSIPGRSTPP